MKSTKPLNEAKLLNSTLYNSEAFKSLILVDQIEELNNHTVEVKKGQHKIKARIKETSELNEKLKSAQDDVK